MKISEETIDVTKSDSLDEETFYIKATPEAFESISGRLYNNRILAPIRELSANAYDAHVDVDKQTLIYVCKNNSCLLPTESTEDAIKQIEKSTR